MLIRKWQDNQLYEVDSTLGTPAPTPEPAHDSAKGKDETVSMTVDQLKRINAKEAKDAKAATERAILERFEKFGAKSFEEIESFLGAQHAKQEAEKTESQKLSERLALLEQQSAAKDAKIAEVERQSRIKERDSELKSLLSNAHNPAQVLILLQAQSGEKLDALIGDSGAFDTEAAKKLIADYQKENSFLFKNTSPASAFSMREGKAIPADRDAKKEAARKISKTIKGF